MASRRERPRVSIVMIKQHTASTCTGRQHRRQGHGELHVRYHGTKLFIKFIGRMLLLILPMS